jgi:hypothetical protein
VYHDASGLHVLDDVSANDLSYSYRDLDHLTPVGPTLRGDLATCEDYVGPIPPR